MARRSATIVFALISVTASAPEAAAEDFSGKRPTLVEAARVRSIPAGEPASGGFTDRSGWDIGPDSLWSGLWERHRWHLLTIFALEQAEYQYERRIGTSTSPILLRDPPGLDVSIHDRLLSESPTSNFVTENKTNIFRGIALASLAATHRLDYGGMADDFLGLAEAHKFNTTTNSLVKMIAGRERPRLEMSDPAGVEPSDAERLRNSEAQHLSFYSAATSEAFTMASYLDLMIAGRLRDHPRARMALASGLYGLASYIGYTRMEQGEHYFTDVAFGAAAGILIGRGSYRSHHTYPGDSAGVRFRLNPPVPIPGGAVVMISIASSAPPAH